MTGGMLLLALIMGYMLAPVDNLVAFVAPFLLFVVGIVFIGPFGLLLAFIASLFTRPGDLIPALDGVPVAKVFAFSAIVLLFSGKLLRRDPSWVRSHFNVGLVALTFGVIVSVIDSTDPNESLTFFNNVFVKIVVLWFLMLETMVTRKRTVMFQATIAVMTATIAGYSVWARFFLETSLIEGSRSSFVGLLADPNDLAMALLMSVPFTAEATLSPKLKRSRPLWILLLLLNVAGLIVTQSRGGLLGLGAAGFIILRQRVRSTAMVGGFMAAALAALVIVSGVSDRATVVGHDNSVVDASARGRLDAWVAGGRMLAYNPVTGVGLFRVTANYSYYAVNPIDWRPKTSHNAFVQAAAETGFLGFIPFMSLVFMAFWSDWRLLREIPDDASPLQRALLRSQLSTLAGVMVAAFFLSVAWSWFFYIVIAQAAVSHRVWLTMPEVLDRRAAEAAETAAANVTIDVDPTPANDRGIPSDASAAATLPVLT